MFEFVVGAWVVGMHTILDAPGAAPPRNSRPGAASSGNRKMAPRLARYRHERYE